MNQSLRRRLEALENTTPRGSVCKDPKVQAVAMRHVERMLAEHGIKPRPRSADPKAQRAAMRKVEKMMRAAA